MFKKKEMLKKRKSYLAILIILTLMSGLFLGGCNNVADENSIQTPEKPKVLFAYIGANLKNPVTDLAIAYEEKTGVKVELTFNNSGALINQVETVKTGDIFMPGGMPFVEQAKQKGHLEEVLGPIAFHLPVLITPQGNPAKISSVKDLAKEGVKLVIPDKDATAIGKTAYKVFGKTGMLPEIEKNILASLETPPKVLAAIMMGQGNVGIVEYSNTFKDREKIEVIEIDPQINEVESIPIALLVYSEQKAQAKDFMKYVQENGPAAFEKYGFKTK